MLGTSKAESSKIQTLHQWANRNQNDLVLVHALRHFDNNRPLIQRQANEVLKTWDVISTSLVSISQIKRTYRTSVKNKLRPMIGEVAFILDVPPQNIIGTLCSDAWFPNHAGRVGDSPLGAVTNPYALVDAIRSGKPIKGNVTKGGFDQINSPAFILKHTPDNYHNEVIIVGRGGVNTYSGFPPTVDIRIKGMIYAPMNHLDMDAGGNSNGYFAAHKLKEKNKISDANFLDLSKILTEY